VAATREVPPPSIASCRCRRVRRKERTKRREWKPSRCANRQEVLRSSSSDLSILCQFSSPSTSLIRLRNKRRSFLGLRSTFSDQRGPRQRSVDLPGWPLPRPLPPLPPPLPPSLASLAPSPPSLTRLPPDWLAATTKQPLSSPLYFPHLSRPLLPLVLPLVYDNPPPSHYAHRTRTVI
jgi:hypothetical protein